MTTNAALLGHRSVRYAYTLLDRELNAIGELDGVAGGGALTWSASRSVKGSGDLTVKGQDVDWSQSRIKISTTVAPLLASVGSGTAETWDLGLWVPVLPGDDWTRTGKSQPLSLLDISSLLARFGPTSTYAVPQGATVTDRVRAIVEAAGLQASVTDSASTLRAGLAWATGCTWLQIINDLLDTINYRSLFADRSGVIRAEPYVAPANRPYVHEGAFVAGKTCIYRPEWSMRQDRDAVPTRMVLVVQSADGVDALVGVYEPPASSQWSSSSRGYVNQVTEQCEATTQDEINAKAHSRWTSLSTPQTTRTVQHATLPLNPSDAVRFLSARARVDRRHVVAKTTVRLSDTAAQETILEEVAE